MPDSNAQFLIDSYCSADYFVRVTGGQQTLLRVGQAVPPTLRAEMRADEGGAFITAWNPASQPLPAEENRRRQRELLNALLPICRRLFVGLGRGDDWRESSLCVLGNEMALLDQFARRFGQNAVLTFLPDEAVRLRCYRESWRSLPAAAHIDFAPAETPMR